MRPMAVALVLLGAGCVDLGTEGQTQTATFRSEDPQLPGVILTGSLTIADGNHSVSAVATNEGERTWRVHAVCVSSLTAQLRHADNSTVQHEEPRAVCLAIGFKDFTRGDNESLRFQWDGQVWDPEAEALRPAPLGDYRWHIEFTAWESEDAPPRTVDGTLDFSVGPTPGP